MAAFLSFGDGFAAHLDEKGRRERRFYRLLSVISFILGAFALWEITCEIWMMIGSIACGSLDRVVAQTIRMLPLYLIGIALIFFHVCINCAYRAGSLKARRARWAVCGVAMILLGSAAAIYVILGIILGEYAKLVEGFITPLFPLDMLIGGLIFVAIGILSFRYRRMLKEKGSSLPYVNDRGLFGRRMWTFGLFRCLSLLAAMCGLAGTVWGIFVVDFSHGYILFSVALLLNYFTSFAMYAAYRFIFCEANEESGGKVSLKLGIIFLIVNVVLFAVYAVTLQIWNEAPGVTAYGILHADYTLGKNAFTIFYGANNLLAPAFAIIRGLIIRKKSEA